MIQLSISADTRDFPPEFNNKVFDDFFLNSKL